MPCCLDRSLVGLSKHRLQLGEPLLDRIEVRTVVRQEQEMHPGLADGLILVAAQVVEDDDAGRRRGDQRPFDIGSERLTVDRLVEHNRCDDPVYPVRLRAGFC